MAVIQAPQSFSPLRMTVSLRFSGQPRVQATPDEAVFSTETQEKPLSRGQRICLRMIDWYQRMTRQSWLAKRLNRETTGIFGCGYKDLKLSDYSCSEYTREAILRHGVIKGIWKGVCRILMCNPLTFKIKRLQKFCVNP